MDEKGDNAGKTGLLFGVALGAAYILRNVVLTVGAGLPEAVLIFPDLLLGLLCLVGVPLIAGVVNARSSRSVGAAMFAGAGTGIVGMLLVALQVILLPNLIPPGLAIIGIGAAQGGVLACWIPLAVGVGGFFGAIGGFFGRATYRRQRKMEKAAGTAARRALAQE